MKRPVTGLLATIGGGIALSLWLFPRAFPAVALEARATRAEIAQRADSFFRASGLAPEGARAAVRFSADESVVTFIDLAAGGKDTLEALVRGRDVAPFTWAVRAFVPGEPREARVHFAPDGRLVAFEQRLAEAEARPTISVDSGRVLAEDVLTRWLAEPRDRWAVVSESYETRAVSDRVDRTYTFERTDRSIGGAPLRLEVQIFGDAPGRAVRRVVTPESFVRRYDAMRSANDRLALLATAGALALMVASLVALRVYNRRHVVRWRPAMALAGVVGGLVAGAALNQVPSSWFSYDTATSAPAFLLVQVAAAVFGGAGMAVMVGFTLAAAEVLTRHAFPQHADWWQLWRHRGTREVAGRVLGGYAAAAAGFAYVALFYVVTRRFLGWWVPSDLLDDPNLIATPAPWLAGIALSAQAAVWEEALFRAIPMSIVALWAAGRPRRSWWMAAGVVATALVFGFAHANYPSWPPYSRGAEIFVEACVWAVLFVRFGLLVTVVAHFAYNLSLFGLFAAAGSGTPYRVTAVITILALLSPALAVAWRWWRQRSLAPLPDAARFAAWRPAAVSEGEEAVIVPGTAVLAPRARRLALVAAAIAGGVVLLGPRQPTLGPAFMADRASAVAVADAALRARGVTPERWRTLTIASDDTLDAWRRFLERHDRPSLAADLAEGYAVPVWWVVRYVRDTADARARAEEWRVRVRPNGLLLDVRHVLPEDEARPPMPAAEVRRRAREALASVVDTSRLAESEFAEEARPARRDVTVTFTDTTVRLPDGALARAWVSLGGDEVLVARRGVELPEHFQREERLRGQRQLMVFLPLALVFVGLAAGGALVVLRRRAVGAEQRLSRRTTTMLIAGLVIAQAAVALNALPRALYQYDTAVTWDAFLQRVTLDTTLSLAGSIVVVALWILMLALARRVGLGILPPAEGRDALPAAVGLGTSLLLAQAAFAQAFRGAIPPAPSTLFDVTVPLASPALGVVPSVALGVPLLAIPALVTLGVSGKRSGRATFGAALLTSVLAAALAISDRWAGLGPWQAALVLAGVAIAVAAAIMWGRTGVVTWVAAASVVEGLDAVRMLVVAPTGTERAAGGLAFVVSAALVVAAVRWRGASSVDHASTP